MTVTQAENLTAAMIGAGASIRPGTVSPAETQRASQDDRPRRMVAVTVALSEPADSAELDWPATVASVLRLTFANSSVTVIDSWRADA